ncbi:MAG: RluA family pseudouridine synthase [Deltaproteobacteria bacterium]|nr:RluA family pseudouridine synthase [Deltaproteobacteria bacterium]
MDKLHSLIADEGGVRLDKYVCQQLPELSRARVQKLIADGHITVNGRMAKPGLRLNTGDKLKIAIPPTPSEQLLPESIPLNILYEDEDLLAVDKPAGLTVHPAPGHTSHTLVNALLAYFPHLADIGDSLRPGIVHRLDKDTSGVMLVAKNSAAQDNLIGQFKSHSVTKAYMVLVKGRLTPDTGIIEAAIGRDPRHRQRMAVVVGGREASTGYQVVKYFVDYTLLEVRPQTGRTHQIRVHLGAIGFPVVGDKIYGVKSPFVPRQFLHACRLGFSLPSSGEYVEFKSELPEDLERALKDIA